MSARFETTRWSLVLAGRGDSEEARDALGALFEAYWQPLYAFVRRHGHDPDSAADLVQGYFLRVMDRDYLNDVDPAKGRFRSFLLASLRHYLSDCRRSDRARSRSPESALVSFDAAVAEGDYAARPFDGLTPEALFTRRWAQVLLTRASRRLEALEREAGRTKLYQGLAPRLNTGGGAPYRQVAADVGLTEAAVKVAMHRLRKRFGALLREEVARTVVDPVEVDDELRALLAAVDDG